MQQIFMSKTLAEAMIMHVTTGPRRLTGTMCWFAHLVPVINGSCTMLMEAESRYCIVFHNLTTAGFSQFPLIFRDRLAREVQALCQTTGNTSKRLIKLVRHSARECRFGIGLDYSISADVYDAARHLQKIVEDLGSFPVIGVTEFGLGIKLNREVLPHLGNGETTALDAFRRYWLDGLKALPSALANGSFNEHWPA